MDSLTQALLGAATFAVVKNKDIGKKSLVIGAIKKSSNQIFIAYIYMLSIIRVCI